MTIEINCEKCGIALRPDWQDDGFCYSCRSYAFRYQYQRPPGLLRSRQPRHLNMSVVRQVHHMPVVRARTEPLLLDLLAWRPRRACARVVHEAQRLSHWLWMPVPPHDATVVERPGPVRATLQLSACQ
jgi:hypothetical protein